MMKAAEYDLPATPSAFAGADMVTGLQDPVLLQERKAKGRVRTTGVDVLERTGPEGETMGEQAVYNVNKRFPLAPGTDQPVKGRELGDSTTYVCYPVFRKTVQEWGI